MLISFGTRRMFSMLFGVVAHLSIIEFYVTTTESSAKPSLLSPFVVNSLMSFVSGYDKNNDRRDGGFTEFCRTVLYELNDRAKPEC